MPTQALFVTPLLRDLLGDSELENLFSAQAEIAAMLRFEVALAEAEAAEGVIPDEASQVIARACAAFRPDESALSAGAARDGVVVPALVRQLRAAVGEAHARHVHFGSTSQDVIDTALMLRLGEALTIIQARLEALIGGLDEQSRREGAKPLMGRTRMQRARPITAARKIANWRDPLQRCSAEIARLRQPSFVLQLGGAVGDRAELGEKAQGVASRLARALNLADSSSSWHTQRDRITALGHALSMVCGVNGKIGADVALMAQNEVAEVKIADGGGSSAMPEKNNPVKAEVLVALARYAATLDGGLALALVHENERSGAAWTLEWMLLPPLVVATGASLRNAQALIKSISFA